MQNINGDEINMEENKDTNSAEKNNSISELEYQRLISRREFDDTMRNQLLTFSFTTVLAVLGVALSIENLGSLNSIICLIPYLLIIPFEARISYYRLEDAHISSFLAVFAEDKHKYPIGAKTVNEGVCKYYKLMAWLINNEMALLGIATGLVFYIRYIPSVEGWNCLLSVPLVIPIISEAIIIILTDSTRDYGKLKAKFETEWIAYGKGLNPTDENAL